MPLGRNARQQRPRPPKYKGNAYVPRVDVFGTLKFPHQQDTRGRLIEYSPDQFAFFTVEEIEAPLLFTTTSEFAIKGRTLTAQSDAGEVRFQKAGCGCETPHQLRGARAPLLQYIPEAQVLENTNGVSAFIETFDVSTPPTPDELTEQLQHVPGAFIPLQGGDLHVEVSNQ